MIGLAAAVVTQPVRRLGLATVSIVEKKPFVIIPAVGLVVATLAIVFDQITDKGVNEVLFSGQSALPGFVEHAGAWSLGTLGLLALCKGLAWSLCLGSFRGGPTFPAMFLGAVGGIAAAQLPGMPSTLGVAVGMGAMIAAMLRLPISAIIIAYSLTIAGGGALVPLIIVGVVVSYLATLALDAWFGAARAADPAATTASAGSSPG